MSKRTIKFTVQYDGGDFAGWQCQKNQRTVQQVMRDAIVPLGDLRPDLMASGRTDAGVHALGQVVGYRTNLDHDLTILHKAINYYLPGDVRILKTEEAALGFRATSDATNKLYRYVIFNATYMDVIGRRYSAWVKEPLDPELLREASLPMVGTMDFACFESEGPNRSSSVRTVRRLEIAHQDNWIRIEIEADGFLYNMARAMVGTMVSVARGKMPLAQVQRAIEAKNRDLAGPTMPPQGLFLVRVDYPT